MAHLILSDRTEPVDPAEVATLLAKAVADQDLRPLPWTDGIRQLQARVALMRGMEPDAGLAGLVRRGSEGRGSGLAGAVPDRHGPAGRSARSWTCTRSCAGWCRGTLAARLDRELPTHLDLPTGRAAIDYTESPPLASAKAQAFYGMATTPLLAGGRVPLRLALLSPAGRPIAVTADLGGFWKGAWADARRDMRGRYPKHHWPEDGANPERADADN